MFVIVTKHYRMGDRLATIDMSQKLGAVPLWERWRWVSIWQRGQGRVLSPYQVAPWSIQQFGHNRHGPKIEGLCPVGEVKLGFHL